MANSFVSSQANRSNGTSDRRAIREPSFSFIISWTHLAEKIQSTAEAPFYLGSTAFISSSLSETVCCTGAVKLKPPALPRFPVLMVYF